ncbi:MAG: leucyl/phenylalanyl-tRNA--protein transferase [Verrucomicrobia bacterium]|nr:MAG: leucyl/phenylalanyl-tRNA--protein transferase [Verrucomicrobiota bacterium]
MIDPKLLLQGYRLGVFPMATEDGAIEWFSPDPRAILPLEDFHVPHALRRLLRRKVFEIKINNLFSEVIKACARRDAHSVEAWSTGKSARRTDSSRGELAGGLYGVAIGGAFFGESMFHRVTDASKIALVVLVEHLRARKFALLDTQWLTPHLQQFGGVEISRNHYLGLLRRAIELPRKFV